MSPTADDFLSCCARWNGMHRSVAYEVGWHGKSDTNPQGIWTYYLFIDEQMFDPDDFKRLLMQREVKEMLAGSYWEHYRYENFPDLSFHGEVTFYDVVRGIRKTDGKPNKIIKVGCDYAHLWDMESGWPYTRDSVTGDAKRSIDVLLERFPQHRERCSYSGVWGWPNELYTAVNGNRVHQSHADKFEDGWSAWRPARSTQEAE